MHYLIEAQSQRQSSATKHCYLVTMGKTFTEKTLTDDI